MNNRVVFALLMFVYATSPLFANDREDSIIIHQQHPNAVEPIVYYVFNDSCYTISPIQFNAMHVVPFMGLKTEMSFNGAASTNIMTQSVFYVYISDTISQVYNINNFRVVKLKSMYDERLLTTSVDAHYYIHTGTYSKGMSATEIGKGLYRITPAKELPSGEYGIFHAFSGNIPTKLYDFSIR